MIIISILAGVIGISVMWFSIGFYENIREMVSARKLRKKAAEEAAQSEGEENEEAEGDGRLL